MEEKIIKTAAVTFMTVVYVSLLSFVRYSIDMDTALIVGIALLVANQIKWE